MSDFFDRLFAVEEDEKIKWSVHTTMTCDTAYTAALLKKQLGNSAELKTHLENGVIFTDKMGVFYDAKHPPTLSVSSRSIPVEAVDALQFSISADTTLHAKLSLVCIEFPRERKRRYRLAVYTKNMEFNNSCAEAALIFDLKPNEKFENSDDAEQLKVFFNVLYERCGKNGWKWIEEHGFFSEGYVWEDLKKCQLIGRLFGDTDSRTASLYFGGCGGEETLGQRLALDTASEQSTVLTPPFFMYKKVGKESNDAEMAGAEFTEGTANGEYHYSTAWNYFKKNRQSKSGPQLYDLKSKEGNLKGQRFSSHIKAYLLEKLCENEPKRHEFWIGSANATTRGIGWDFVNNTSKKPESIECLVKFSMNEDEFKCLRKSFCGAYESFDFNPESSTLKINPDRFGPYFCSHYRATSITYHNAEESEMVGRRYGDTHVLKICFEYVSSGKATKNVAFKHDQIKWHPAEYSYSVDLDDAEQEMIAMCQDVVLTFTFKKFKPSQGYLCFGSSNSIMSIAHLLQLEENSSVPREYDLEPNTTLTDWLKDKDALINADATNLPERLKWYHKVLIDSLYPENTSKVSDSQDE